MKESAVQFNSGISGMRDVRAYPFYSARFGPFRILGNDCFITGLDFLITDNPSVEEVPGLINSCMIQVQEYFSGKRFDFEIPLYVMGTPYFIKVWKELLKIPYGETISYAQLATRTGNSNSARAVGHVNSLNPVSIIIPCHRVLGSSGKLVGYSGGLKLKKQLIDHEKLYTGQILDLQFTDD